ncbi:MAG: hypothetical protein AB7Q91_11960 [Phycisphaerales bacterium]
MTGPLMLAMDDWWIGAFVIGLVWLVLSFVHKTVRTFARERSRREIAAYIAEGSISAEQGERLMKAGEPREA